jgi:hypothetical protein
MRPSSLADSLCDRVHAGFTIWPSAPLAEAMSCCVRSTRLQEVTIVLDGVEFFRVRGCSMTGHKSYRWVLMSFKCQGGTPPPLLGGLTHALRCTASLRSTASPAL